MTPEWGSESWVDLDHRWHGFANFEYTVFPLPDISADSIPWRLNLTGEGVPGARLLPAFDRVTYPCGFGLDGRDGLSRPRPGAGNPPATLFERRSFFNSLDWFALSLGRLDLPGPAPI